MEVGEILALVLPILGLSGGLVLAGLKGWSSHKVKMREAPEGDTERLFEAMQQLHDELGSVREDVAELQERMDFTERVLSEVKARNAIGPGDATQVNP